MLASECMSKKVELGKPDMTLQDAAKKMREGDFGLLPIADDDRLVGMLTDRDITVRAVAEGKNPREALVRDFMSHSVFYCYDDDTIENVLEKFSEQQVRRLPVLNRQKRLVGILSLGDVAKTDPPAEKLEETLSQVSSKSIEGRSGMHLR